MQSLGRAARFIHQVIGPFRPIAPTILQGIDLEYKWKTHPHLPAQCVLTFLSHIFTNALHTHQTLGRGRTQACGIPQACFNYTRPQRTSEIHNGLQYLRNSPLGRLCEYPISSPYPCSSFNKLEHAGNKDRTKDLAMIRKHGDRYIPSVYGYTGIGGTKDNLSHHDITAARLLCPRRLRDWFDRDMEYFCDDIRNGDRPYPCSDWPSFLYPETIYNPDAVEKGLMRGPFLLSVSIFG
jgi:hypothetical protein